VPASEISRDTSPLRLTRASPFRRHTLDHAKPMEDPSDDDRPTHHPLWSQPVLSDSGVSLPWRCGVRGLSFALTPVGPRPSGSGAGVARRLAAARAPASAGHLSNSEGPA
jgi:hypothetical protein